MKIQIFFMLAFCINCWATKDYINQYFPQDSLVRKVHNSQPHGTGWFGFDNDVRAACDHLNNLFEQVENRPHKDDSIWYVYVYDSLKSSIQAITSDQGEDVIQNELNWAWQLKKYLDAKAAQTYLSSHEYQQELEQEKKLKRIQTAIILKDL